MRSDESENDARIETLTNAVRALEERVKSLEALAIDEAPPIPTVAPSETIATAPPAAVRAPAPVAKPVPPIERVPGRDTPPEAPAFKPSLSSIDFEELLGARLLAWIGGIAVVLGVVFFMTTAIHRGWIDEQMRTVLAFAGSTVLLGVGVWVYERLGRTQTAQITVGAAIAALYASLTAATALYHLVGRPEGFAVAGLIGVVACALAVRWNSIQVAAIGILGALLAPVLVDAGSSLSALVFMALALVGAVGVVLWQRWPWLATLAYVVSLPQLLFWIEDTYESNLVRALVALLVFWALYLVAAIGYDLRAATLRLRASSAMLAFSDVVVTSGVGYALLRSEVSVEAGTVWVIAMAVVHIAVGALVGWLRSSAREIGLLAVAIGVGLSAIGLGLALDGPALVTGWAVEAVLLAWLYDRTGSRRAFVGALAFVALAGIRALNYEYVRLDNGTSGARPDYEAVVALVTVAVAIVLVTRFLSRRSFAPFDLRLLDGVAIVFLAAACDIAFSGWQLPVVWVSLAFALVLLSRKLGGMVPAISAITLLALASVHAVAVEVPPNVALDQGLERVGIELAVLLFLACGWIHAGATYRLEGLDVEEAAAVRNVVYGAGAIAALYFGSALVVTIAPEGTTGGTQTGQMMLSVFWALCGLGLLVVGLKRGYPWSRRGGLALLVLAAAKVFTYDLTSLDQMARVLSLIGLGLLLLVATFLYQRAVTGDREKRE